MFQEFKAAVEEARVEWGDRETSEKRATSDAP